MAEVTNHSLVMYDGSYIQRVPSLPMTSEYVFGMSVQPGESGAGASVEVTIPAGYTVTRNWEVTEAINATGITTGMSGTGAINLPFSYNIAGGPPNQSVLVKIRITDTITAGPVDTVYQPLGIYLVPPDVVQTEPSPADGSPIFLFDASCGVASNIRNDRVTLSGTLQGDGGALGAYSQTFYEVGTVPGVYTQQQEVPFSPESPATFMGLAPNTTYYWRFKVVSEDPNPMPPGTVLFTSADCGSFTTLPNDTRAECASDRNEVHSHQISMFGSALGLPVGDFVRFVVSTSPTGPWEPGDPSVVFLGSNRPIVTGANPETFRHVVPHDGLFLQPSTDYYWVVQRIASDGTTILTQSPEVCHVTTRADDDENYILCNPNPVANQFGRTTIINSVAIPTGNEDFPAQLGGDRIQVDVGPTANGPWTLAVNYAGNGGSISGNVPGANPNTGVNPGGGLGASIGDLIHNTRYFTRHTLFNVNAPGLNPVQEVVCGPFVTNDRPNPQCANQIQNITQRSARLRFFADTARENPNGPATRATFSAGDVVQVEAGLTPTGPFNIIGTFTAANAPTQFSGQSIAQIDLTGLTPDTEYYYRVRCTEAVETGGEYWLSPVCATPFRTLPLPNCETVTVTDITSINAKITIAPADWLAGDDVRVLVSTSPTGPFNAALVHTVEVTNEPITLDFLSVLLPAHTYYYRIEIDHQPETGIPDYLSPICSFTTTGGGTDVGPFELGSEKCMNECNAPGGPTVIVSSGCGCN